MRDVFFLIYMAAAILLISCSNKYDMTFPEAYEIDKNIREESIKLNVETVEDSYKFINAKDFFVYRDSILVVLNKANRDYHFVELYNLNAKDTIARFIRMGNGPGEMLLAGAHMRQDTLFVHDVAKNQIAFIDLEKAIYEPDYSIRMLQFKPSVAVPFVSFVNADKLILLNPYYFKNRSIKIDNDVPRIIVHDLNQGTEIDLGDHKYNAFNVSQGFIIPFPLKNRIVFASLFDPVIEIYDENLSPVKAVYGPDKLIPSYSITENNAICFRNYSTYGYLGYYASENYFYTTYVGDYLEPSERSKDLTSSIFKFDWDGNLIQTYSSPVYLNNLSLSADGKTFYSRGYDEDGTVVLWKLSTADGSEF